MANAQLTHKLNVTHTLASIDADGTFSYDTPVVADERQLFARELFPLRALSKLLHVPKKMQVRALVVVRSERQPRYAFKFERKARTFAGAKATDVYSATVSHQHSQSTEPSLVEFKVIAEEVINGATTLTLKTTKKPSEQSIVFQLVQPNEQTLTLALSEENVLRPSSATRLYQLTLRIAQLQQAMASEPADKAVVVEFAESALQAQQVLAIIGRGVFASLKELEKDLIDVELFERIKQPLTSLYGDADNKAAVVVCPYYRYAIDETFESQRVCGSLEQMQSDLVARVRNRALGGESLSLKLKKLTVRFMKLIGVIEGADERENCQRMRLALLNSLEQLKRGRVQNAYGMHSIMPG